MKKLLLIFGLLIFTIHTFATDYYIATQQLNVRTGPSTKYKVALSINAGDEVQIIDNQIASWYKIQYHDTIGYVSSKYLKFSRTLGENQSKEEASWIEEYRNPLVFSLVFLILILIVNSAKSNRSNSNQNDNQANDESILGANKRPIVVVTKSTKSVGQAIFLVLVFGPIGMFYSTIMGAIIMLIIAPIIIVILIASSNFGSFIIALLIYYPVCILWAANAARSHNRNIMN